MSQNGLGDGKLTALELRTGFERLVTHIARRECCCRAYKCDKIATYGLPFGADAEDSTANAGVMDGGLVNDSILDSTEKNGFEPQRNDISQVTPDHYGGSSVDDVGEAQCSGTAGADVGATATAYHCATVAAGIGDTDHTRIQRNGGERAEEEWTPESGVHSSNRVYSCSQKSEQHQSHDRQVGDDAAGVNNDRGGSGNVTVPDIRQQGWLSGTGGNGGSGNAAAVSVERHSENGGVDENRELPFDRGGEDTDIEEAIKEERRSSVDLLNAGGAIACRKHALDGMVYLGQR